MFHVEHFGNSSDMEPSMACQRSKSHFLKNTDIYGRERSTWNISETEGAAPKHETESDFLRTPSFPYFFRDGRGRWRDRPK